MGPLPLFLRLQPAIRGQEARNEGKKEEEKEGTVSRPDEIKLLPVPRGARD